MSVSMLILGNLYVDDGKYLSQFLVPKIHSCETSQIFFLAWADFIVIGKRIIKESYQM